LADTPQNSPQTQDSVRPLPLAIGQHAIALLHLRPPRADDYGFMRKLATDATIIQMLGRDLEPEARTQLRLDNTMRGNADGSARPSTTALKLGMNFCLHFGAGG